MGIWVLLEELDTTYRVCSGNFSTIVVSVAFRLKELKF